MSYRAKTGNIWGEPNRARTKSVWGEPNPSYFRFLNYIETRGLPKTLCILGCYDGKFVIPAAKKGFRVLAIDMDKTGLYGGETYIGNKKVHVGGLSLRLKQEGVERDVDVIEDNFLDYIPKETFSGVFSSGSIHYEENAKYPLDYIVNRLKSYVSTEGVLFLEYIHASKNDNDPNRHFVTKKQIDPYFNNQDWIILNHTKHTYTESPNPRSLYIHEIVWGKLRVAKR